jgi:hypothetical protein
VPELWAALQQVPLTHASAQGKKWGRRTSPLVAAKLFGDSAAAGIMQRIAAFRAKLAVFDQGLVRHEAALLSAQTVAATQTLLDAELRRSPAQGKGAAAAAAPVLAKARPREGAAGGYLLPGPLSDARHAEVSGRDDLPPCDGRFHRRWAGPF